MTDQTSPAASADEPVTPAAPPRARTPRALAVTGIAVAGALTRGRAFAGGGGGGSRLAAQRPPLAVEVRGPFGGPSAERFDDRQQRGDDRRGERAERRELFERWLEQHGDLPAETDE